LVIGHNRAFHGIAFLTPFEGKAGGLVGVDGPFDDIQADGA